LTLSAARADGTSLPGWLDFEGRRFSGTPRNADVGNCDIRLSATDRSGGQASGVFRLSVANVNDAPTVANPLVTRSFEAGARFTVAVPADTFADEDLGDSLTLGAAVFGGAPLPNWLRFDAATATLSGNPVANQNGISHILVTATDSAGASASSDFGLVIRAKAGSSVAGGKGDDVIFGGTGNETLIAKGGNDYLFGDIGDDVLKGGTGNDVLQGGEGADIVRGGSGRNVLDGGSGNDVIYDGSGSSLIVGGKGSDTVRTGQGRDVLLFNRGDGADTVIADRAGDHTLSLGGGIRYSDLSLSRSGKDLVLDAGSGDRLRFKDWFQGRQSVLSLQIITDASSDFDANSSDPLRNHRVERFDFLGMVNAFDDARRSSPSLTSWSLTNALLRFHLTGADAAALGGDLAYCYGNKGSLAGISLSAAQQVIGASGFGSEAQSLRPFTGLQEGFVKLS
jgi:Ca2+-binding RTX toxin-like protein